jgi:hypothetical protein
VHELLKLVSTFATEARSTEIERLLKTATPSTRRAWHDLVKVATRQGTADDANFSDVLVKIRNNAAYHYYQTKLPVRGFRRHFFESARNPLNAAAFASVGKNMEQTRFYFADAAMKSTIDDLAAEMGGSAFGDRLRRTVRHVNIALAHIVTSYIAAARTI